MGRDEGGHEENEQAPLNGDFAQPLCFFLKIFVIIGFRATVIMAVKTFLSFVFGLFPLVLCLYRFIVFLCARRNTLVWCLRCARRSSRQQYF